MGAVGVVSIIGVGSVSIVVGVVACAVVVGVVVGVGAWGERGKTAMNSGPQPIT